MISKTIDLNSINSQTFTLCFEDTNHFGLATDQELITRWLRDLRSGKYKQIKGQMFDQNSDLSYCAVGILYKKRILKARQQAQIDGEEYCELDLESFVVRDNRPLSMYISLTTDEGCAYSLENFVLELNDYCSLNFKTIADILEIIHKEIRGEEINEIFTKLNNQNKWVMSDER